MKSIFFPTPAGEGLFMGGMGGGGGGGGMDAPRPLAPVTICGWEAAPEIFMGCLRLFKGDPTVPRSIADGAFTAGKWVRSNLIGGMQRKLEFLFGDPAVSWTG